MSVLAERVKEIEEELDYLDRDEKFEWLIGRGKSLDVATEFTDDDLVKGCQSKVWLRVHAEDGVVKLEGTSDAMIVKGLVGLLMELFNGAPNREVRDFDFVQWMEKNNLGLTYQRMQGVAGMLRRIQHEIR